LKAVRQDLRESLPGTTLCNENEFAKAIEQAYQKYGTIARIEPPRDVAPWNVPGVHRDGGIGG